MKRGLISAAVATASVALFAVPFATADHKPDHQTPPAGTDLSISASKNPVVWPRSTTLSGRFRGSDTASKTVELQEDPYPYGEFKRLGNAQTDADGNYTFAATPGLNTKYRATTRVDGAEVISPEVLVGVKVRVTRTVSDHTPRRGQVVVFSGFVGPAHDGRTVYIQRRKADGSWGTVATTTLVDAGEADASRSNYTRDVRVNRDGTYRVLVKGHGDHLGNKSRRVRLDTP